MTDDNAGMNVRTALIVDIGIFAHNQEQAIGSMMVEVARQTILRDRTFSVRVLVLANGCTDATAAVAAEASRNFPWPDAVTIVDLPHGGKSRTWNRFVGELGRRDADVLVFCDADISLPREDTICNLVRFVADKADVDAASSLPVKDIDYHPQRLGPVEKMISAGGGSMGSIRTAICGQLYAMHGDVARALHIPIGLPVEDGFVRHSIITRMFSAPIDLNRIDDAMHVYPSERTLSSLLRHQVRIVIGGAINAALFAHLIRLRRSSGDEGVAEALALAARDPQWLPRVLRNALPTKRFGWVPWPFLLARTREFVSNGARSPPPSRSASSASCST